MSHSPKDGATLSLVALERIDQICLGFEAAWKAGKYEQAAELFAKITTDDNYVEFLTLPAYDLID